MNLELNVVRFENEDVIATSGITYCDSKAPHFYVTDPDAEVSEGLYYSKGTGYSLKEGTWKDTSGKLWAEDAGEYKKDTYYHLVGSKYVVCEEQNHEFTK